MGDAGDAGTSMRIPFFTAWKDHCSGKRTNTELTVLETFREIHSDKHITVVSPQSCDFLGYAQAGHAHAQLITDGDSFVSQRTYKAPASRLESGDGKLGDNVIFGHYDYTFQGSHFPFYLLEWNEATGLKARVAYILSPKSDVNTHAHSTSADHLITVVGRWTSQLHEEIYVFDSGVWLKNHDLWSAVQSSSWDDVILDVAMKDTLINDVSSFFDSRSVYEEYSVPWKRGIIFHGTPGCGKTISIKALMNNLQGKDVASLYVKSFSGCQGLQHSIRVIFTQARNMAPCLLIFEDLDSLVVDEVRSYFLNEVDGLESNNGILMIGSTNHLERLDPGISKRPSRFDRKYHFKLPGEQERILYCEYWKKKLEKNSKIDFQPEICEIVAKLTDGFSFAYMKELFVQTLLAIVGGRAESEDDRIDEEALEEVAEKTHIVDDSARLAQEGESTQSTAAGETTVDSTSEDAKVARQVPEVHVPEHLQSNALLRILRKQVAVLIRDMDSTKDDEVANRPKIPGGRGAAKTPGRVARRTMPPLEFLRQK